MRKEIKNDHDLEFTNVAAFWLKLTLLSTNQMNLRLIKFKKGVQGIAGVAEERAVVD